MRRVTPRSLFRHETHEEARLLLDDEKTSQGKGNDANLGLFQQMQKRRFESLSKEKQAEYAERAKALNEEQAEALSKPASDDVIAQ